MEKALYPSKYISISKGYMTDTHKNSYAIDEIGIDNTVNNIKAPFTGVIKKIYKSDINEVWFESLDQILFADGTIDYMTVLFCTKNDINNLFIGKIINQGDFVYKQSMKESHCHITCSKGKFIETSWHKNKEGFWNINNERKPEDSFFLDKDIVILNTNGYKFKNIENKIDKTIHNKRHVFTCKSTGMYKIKLKSGEKLYIE